MRTALLMIVMIALNFGCQQNNNAATTDPNVHKVIAIEKINTSQYTYLRVDDNGKEKWLAFPITDIKLGETYYYGNEMPMSNFVSKELNRTFPIVYFVEGVSLEPPTKKIEGNGQNMNPQPLKQTEPHTGNAEIKVEKLQVIVEPAKGIITIADLFANKEKYAGKKVRVKGKVSKFSPEIMNKNWIHLQDGTEFEGVFDLTITTNDMVKQGDVITCEGIVTLNKDFGAGYFYKILLEDASTK